MNIKAKKDMVLPNLYEFFKESDHINKMLPIIMGESKISIRVLDYFITNYSKTKKVYYKIGKEIFNVHMNYKDQLDGYRKKLFDPFCRNKRIPFYYNETQYVITTVAQLNFFRWAITNKVLDYVDENFTEIYKDMQRKKELIESDAVTSNDITISTMLAKTQSESSPAQKIIYSSEKIEISFDI
jgi:hypothetical protein